MHKNEMFYALICINNHIISCIISILSHAHTRLTLGESYLPMREVERFLGESMVDQIILGSCLQFQLEMYLSKKKILPLL